MAKRKTGSPTGKFGVRMFDIQDGETEEAWYDTNSERNKVYRNMKEVKSLVVTKISR